MIHLYIDIRVCVFVSSLFELPFISCDLPLFRQNAAVQVLVNHVFIDT